MRAINAAYRVLSDPTRRAAYDARRYLRRPTAIAATRPATPPSVPYVGRVVVQPPPASTPPTPLQRRVDRVVAVLGVLLLLALAFYVVNVIPSIERQSQLERQALSSSSGVPARGVGRVRTVPQQPIANEHARGPSVPERLRTDANLRNFPGTVLVAPAALAPFAALPILRLDATGQGIARYAVYYGDLTTGGATISGLVGRASFDTGPPKLPDCAPDATYCVGPVPGQTSGPPGLEIFRAPGLVEDYPAVVVHRVCCNGVFWSVSWYEPTANMSYSIDLSRAVALRYGNEQASDDEAAARAVAALAPMLVRLP
jgi:hypothetical protein